MDGATGLNVLRTMLTYCRPAGSTAERAFVARYVETLPGAYRAIGENWIVTIGDAPILWSCHTDTVHRASGRQTIHESSQGIASLSKRSKASGSNCLGADDTAGVWLCSELIRAGVPGSYVFHFAEERGGIGSRALARSDEGAAWLAGFTYAIAFDRRGVGDIITHQGGRTASDAFAQSLAGILGAAGLPGYAPAKGIYTDTAEYSDIIPECSNLSVGYRHEHSKEETLDLRHIVKLRDALIRADVSGLVCERKPGDDDPYVPSSYIDATWSEDYNADWFSYLKRRETQSYRLDPEYDEVQRQLDADADALKELGRQIDAQRRYDDLVLGSKWRH